MFATWEFVSDGEIETGLHSCVNPLFSISETVKQLTVLNRTENFRALGNLQQRKHVIKSNPRYDGGRFP